MTTVAFREGVLAADSYAADSVSIVQMVKCARLAGGDVAGAAGSLPKVAQALAWLVGGGKGDPPDISDAEVLFTDGGVLYLAEGGWPGVRVKGYAAIGSGAQGALTAMKLGFSAEAAVAAVAGVDPCTGGEIDVLEVKPPKKRVRKTR